VASSTGLEAFIGVVYSFLIRRSFFEKFPASFSDFVPALTFGIYQSNGRSPGTPIHV